MRYRHVILDRDGVLNRAPPSGWLRDSSEWASWEAGALTALVRLARGGRRVSVATCQSCVGRGLVPAAAVEAIHDRLRREALGAGARVDAICVCMHAPDAGCACRKPRPGLYEAAILAAGISVEATIAVGDALRDLQAARAAGLAAALVRTGWGRRTEREPEARGIAAFDGLGDFALWLDVIDAPAIAGSPRPGGG